LRLTDAFTVATRNDDFYTADPRSNRLIQSGGDQEIPVALQSLVKALPPDLMGKARDVYESETRRPRRIDYLWVESFFPGYCVDQQLFGTETNAEGFPASDHYGVLTTFSRIDGPCPGTPLAGQ